MEVFVAKFDYEKEREDLLSFKEGEKFHIASKADKKWWAAYSVETGDYGYVPSSYMEVSYIQCIQLTCIESEHLLCSYHIRTLLQNLVYNSTSTARRDGAVSFLTSIVYTCTAGVYTLSPRRELIMQLHTNVKEVAI